MMTLAGESVGRRTVRSGAPLGVDAVMVNVEVDLTRKDSSLPYFEIAGLPESTAGECKVRVLSAIRSSGCALPLERVVRVALAPAGPRECSGLDLPIALGVLAAAGTVDLGPLADCLVAGELALDGSIRPIRGVLALTATALKVGMRKVVVPRENAREASEVEGVEVLPVDCLGGLLDALGGGKLLSPFVRTEAPGAEAPDGVDFSDIRGLEGAKRAMVIAAAGGHHAVLVGPPGSGRTMLARRVPTILPELTDEEALQTSKVYSVVGLLRDRGLIRQRPFRAPHHTISEAGLIGGCSTARPGELSLAHNGVLFLDELPEFRANVLQALGEALEAGEVTLARGSHRISLPSRAMLIAAMTPCACGHAGALGRTCRCEPTEMLLRYRSRVPGALLDRIDLQVTMPLVRYCDLASQHEGEKSSTLRERVRHAREIQLERFGKRESTNAQMTPRQLRRFCEVDVEGAKLLQNLVQQTGLGARDYDRILKVARTIADLESSEQIGVVHLNEAIGYRMPQS